MRTSTTLVRMMNIVFIHGACANGSVGQDTHNVLRAHGCKASVMQNPLTMTANDVAAIDGILVAHHSVGDHSFPGGPE